MQPIRIASCVVDWWIGWACSWNLYWLANEFFFANLHDDDIEISYAASLFHSIADFLWIIDRSPMFLNAVQMQSAYNAGRTYLKSQILLAELCLKRVQLRWKYRPKIHFLDHQVDEILGGWNPRFWQCWMDEDFMGKIAVLASRVHPRTCSHRIVACHMFM